MSHCDPITEPPPGFHSLAYSDNSPIAVMANSDNIIGLQFHPEVVHTSHGKQLVENFLYRICGCKGDWTAGNVITESNARNKGRVGEDSGRWPLSGGSDYAVTDALWRSPAGGRVCGVVVRYSALSGKRSGCSIVSIPTSISRSGQWKGHGEGSSTLPILTIGTSLNQGESS